MAATVKITFIGSSGMVTICLLPLCDVARKYNVYIYFVQNVNTQ
jgi:hypothetical protein